MTMKCTEEVLHGHEGNYILPFLWLHGEENNRIIEEIDSIERCGVRRSCVESRPIRRLERLWWEQLGIILREAEKKEHEGMGAG